MSYSKQNLWKDKAQNPGWFGGDSGSLWGNFSMEYHLIKDQLLWKIIAVQIKLKKKSFRCGTSYFKKPREEAPVSSSQVGNGCRFLFARSHFSLRSCLLLRAADNPGLQLCLPCALCSFTRSISQLCSSVVKITAALARSFSCLFTNKIQINSNSSPDYLGTACSSSSRNSQYLKTQILEKPCTLFFNSSAAQGNSGWLSPF